MIADSMGDFSWMGLQKLAPRLSKIASSLNLIIQRRFNGDLKCKTPARSRRAFLLVELGVGGGT